MDSSQVEAPADGTIRVYDDAGALVAEAPYTTTKSIASSKVRSSGTAPSG
jgi:hypothetical protein